MEKIQINCKTCNYQIGDQTIFCFYQQSSFGVHLIIKPEAKNKVLNNILISDQTEKKSKKFSPEVILCKSCSRKLGSNSCLGPKDKLVLCFKSESIYFELNFENGKKQKIDFTFKTKWRNEKDKYPLFEFRNFDNIDGDVKEIISKTNFIETVFPSPNDVQNFNIATLIEDLPRTYQTELYVSALFSNTIIFLPTGAGKTLISAMLIAFMKRLNPKKKIFFVTDRIPLVFQQSSYLRYQTGLTVGEFCGENSNLMESQLDSDIYVLTAGFLINILLLKKVYLEDCSCLVIDEIHHAKNGHTFWNLLENFYHKIEKKFRPRILGMSASPTSGAKKQIEMQNEIVRLCSLIEGQIFMPILYKEDFEKAVTRPDFNFIIAEDHPNEKVFIDKINQFIIPFMTELNSHLNFNSKMDVRNTNLKNYLNNMLKEANIKKDLKRFAIANFLQSIFSSIEVMKIFGVTKAAEILKDGLKKELERNRNNPVLSRNLINLISDFMNTLNNLRGDSNKISSLVNLLKSSSHKNQDSRVIIFVRARKTARLLYEFLIEDKAIKNFWKPKFFVGHASGNLDGMGWSDEQEPTLIHFNEGRCKLLVSTNVLQEGLDVKICDKVILFDPLWSLTEYVQSRGRARHKDSEFIVIDTLEQNKFYVDLTESEKNLINLVNSISKYHKIDKDLVQRQVFLVSQTPKKASNNEMLNSRNSGQKKFKFSFQIYLTSGLIQDLLSCLNKCKGFTQSNSVKNSYLDLEIFDNQAEILNCLFELPNNKVKIDEDALIAQTIKFLMNQPNFNCGIYLFKNKTNSYSNLFITSKELEYGNLATPFEFYGCSSLFKRSTKFIIDHSMRVIRFLLFENRVLYKFEFEFDSIDHLVCIDIKDEDFDVYIPFKRAPFIYVCNSNDNAEIINVNNLKNIDEQYLKWDRSCFNDFELTFKLKFNKTERKILVDSLNSLKGIKLLYSKVNNKTQNFTINNLKNNFKSKEFKDCYSLEAFISQCYYLLNGKISQEFSSLLNEIDSKMLEQCLEKLTFRIISQRFLNILELLRTIIKNSSPKNNYFDENLKLVFIRRATITPTRIFYYFPEPNFSNRVIREYDADNFIRIRFRDEDSRKLNTSQSFFDLKDIYSRIEDLLKKGICLYGRLYEFLAMSSSQMREHGCWLFYKSSMQNAETVRNWMGNFKNIRCVGKYAARLGQSLSSSVETFETQKFSILPDIKIGNYCFTDGIGKISVEKAKEISETFFNKINYSSVYQIRFSGFKGVVAVDPNLKDHELQLRESMKKFESGHNKLDVLNLANYIPCYLNRQIIIILSSLGIPDSAFEKLHDDMLKSLGDLLIDRNLALNFILKYYRSIFPSCDKKADKLDYTCEPFFRDLLKTIYQKMLVDLIGKSRVFVEKGRILMGTIDEIGILKEDEIFVQCSKQITENLNEEEVIDLKNGNFIVNKSVVVAKNPCMHPGDVRVLKAVDRVELRHMVDCVVFPSVGPRPITNMCSGSDLDGDLYFVTWDSSLIPTEVHKPMDYDSEPAKEKDSDILIEDVIQFFVDFIKMDQLGKIANAHVAISDKSELGVKDPMCIELSKVFSQAVDFPKTGKLAELPPEIKVENYPDFMEKTGPSYKSNKVIGKMYRKCKTIFLNEFYSDSIQMNPSFIIDGYEKYLPHAKELYHKYRLELERIMAYFGCWQESELFVGLYLGSNKSDEANDFHKLSRVMIKNLWSLMRKNFDEYLNKQEDSKNRKEIAYQIASAWYHACYSNNENKQLRILSFPWILEDVLCNFDIKNYNILSESIIEKFISCRNDLNLISRFIGKIKLKEDLEDITGLKLIICGSFGLFLFEENYESQLFIYNPVEQATCLINDNVKETLEDYFENVFLNDGILSCNDSEDLSFTISESNSSVKRFLYIRRHIFTYPQLLPVFYTIIHFARQDDLFLHLKLDKIKLENYLEFCIEYFISKNFITEIDYSVMIKKEFEDLANNKNSFDLFDDWLKLHDVLDDIKDEENITGKMILSFYKDNAFKNENFEFNSKFEDNFKRLEENSNQKIKNHFFRVFNYVSKASRINDSWNSLSLSEEPEFRLRCSLSKIRGKSQNIFMENASLLLFSNLNSQFDPVDFEVYNGKRRALHLSKECYSVNSKRPAKFTNECFEEFCYHSLTQFNKAKEIKTDYEFRALLKFGNFYLTNVPPFFLQDSSTVSLTTLRDALKRGYKKINFDFHPTETTTSVLGMFNDNESINSDLDLDLDENPFGFDLDIISERDIDDIYDYDVRPSIKKKKKRKNKKVKCKASSAFDSNMNNDDNYLNSIFLDNEFEWKQSESYMVYCELTNLTTNKSSSYRIKYNSDMELLRVETLPIKWLNIDVRTDISKLDVRFNLVSGKTIEVDSSSSYDEIFENSNINDGIVRKLNDSLIVTENFRNLPSIYVRHSKSIKYNGSYENWKPIFDMTEVTLPENINLNLLEKIKACVSITNEYSDNDEKGLFTKQEERKEFGISFKVDINNMKAKEINDLVVLIWHLSQVFTKILN